MTQETQVSLSWRGCHLMSSGLPRHPILTRVWRFNSSDQSFQVPKASIATLSLDCCTGKLWHHKTPPRASTRDQVSCLQIQRDHRGQRCSSPQLDRGQTSEPTTKRRAPFRTTVLATQLVYFFPL